ncbi:unnamed protein product [Symbiodinium sp. CCMP2592]|nr:unnamed protein product [Symbiodinium sp. CCMP2592]
MSKRPASVEAAAAASAWPRRRRVADASGQPAALPAAEHGSASNSVRRPASAGIPHLCRGLPGEPCCFSVSVAGQPARYHDASRQCPWCNNVLLQESFGTERGCGNLSRSLRFFWQQDKSVYHKAVGRLPQALRLHWPLKALGLSPAFHSVASLQATLATPHGRGRVLAMLRKRQATDRDLVSEALKALPAEYLEDFETKLAQEPRRARQARQRAAAETVEQRWERLLARRRRLRVPSRPDEEAAVYGRRAAEDRVRVRRKFFPAQPKEVRHTGRQWSNPWTDAAAERVRDVADNDTGLPRAATTPLATMLEDWCKQGAWAICERCFSLEPRHLKEVDTRRVADPAVPNCRWCRRDGVESVPTVDRVPRQLQGLCHHVVAALPPFDIDCGPYQRPPHGYRVHTALLRLLWSDTDVEAKIAALEHRTWRTKAKKAFKFLMQHSCSEYRNFVTQHRRFLRDHPMPTDAARRRPLQTLETPGIETALWPDLYYNSDLCESVERATDARRLQRQGLLHEDSDDDDPEREDDPGRGSLRRSFLKKALLHQMRHLLRSRLHLEGPEQSKARRKQQALAKASPVRRSSHQLHAVLFVEKPAAVRLHEKLHATEPPEGHPLRGYVLDQLSYSGSGWPVHEAPSCWDTVDEVVHLHHTEQDAEQGVRAYGLEEVDILKGHVDNIAPQAAGSGGRGLLMRYVATYNVKFSNSFHNEMLADTGVSGYGMALRILSTLHPSEPEMWVTLFKQLFPDFALGGTMLPIVAPWPTMDAQPEFVRRYEQCVWRSDNMSLLEYLRKSNAAGEVVAWIQKLHAAADSALDLGEFASVQTTFGEKVVAAETVSIFSDKYFGQWLMLHVPFRSAAAFLFPDIVAKIPTRYQLFACALRAAGDYWTDKARVREDMQLAAHKDATIASFLALLDAQREIVEQYLRGDISLEDEVPEPALPSLPGAAGLERPRFNRQQQALERCALERLDLIQALKDAQTPEEADDVALRLEEQNSVLVCMGGPGTGKTFVADYLVRVAVRRGHRVLYALPTGQLACRMRQRHPDIHVDTCAGAFLFYRPESETLALMAEYDMVVIDEALQLSAEEYGRLHAMFCATGKQLLLLLMGDDCQLPSIHPQQACDHAQWRFTHVVTLTEVRRCKCAVLQAKLDFLRHHKPLGQEGKRFVNRLCYRHKAWTGHDEPTSLDIDSVFKRTGGKTPSQLCIPDVGEAAPFNTDEDPAEEGNDEGESELPQVTWPGASGPDWQAKYYAQDGSDVDWEAAHEGHVKWCQAAGVNPEVTEEEPETEPVAEIGSRCGSCHWLDGDGNWHVGDVPEDEQWDEADEAAKDEADENDEEWLEDEQQDAAHDGEDQLEHWAPDAEEPWETAEDGEQWEEQCEDDDAGQDGQWEAVNDDGDGEWEENDDEPNGQCEAAAENGEQWEAAAENGEQWEAAAENDEQWDEADGGVGHDHEQWEAAENDDEPEQDGQWEGSAEAHEGLWPADDEGPSAKEQQHEDEEWQAPAGDHAVATLAEKPTDWVNWPKAPATNVTQDYPSKAEVERLDAWWSRYKVKEPTTADEKEEITSPDLPTCPKSADASREAATRGKADRTRDLKGIRDPSSNDWLLVAAAKQPEIPNEEAAGATKGKKKGTRPPYADTEYNIQRKAFFATWNYSDERKLVLQDMDINEMKRRDAKRMKVKDANRIARRVAYLSMEYQHRSGSFYIIENPTGSMLFEYACIKARLRAHGATSINLCLGALGAPSKKCVTLWGTAPFLYELYEQLTGSRRNQLRRIQSFLKKDISSGYVDRHGRARRVAGLLHEHFKIPRSRVDETDMELHDTSDGCSSDSGLEDLIGMSSS